jgi:hypothetical protein
MPAQRAAEVPGIIPAWCGRWNYWPITRSAEVRRTDRQDRRRDGVGVAHDFFAALGDQVITGPTLTNVNDFRAILVIRKPQEAA